MDPIAKELRKIREMIDSSTSKQNNECDKTKDKNLEDNKIWSTYQKECNVEEKKLEEKYKLFATNEDHPRYYTEYRKFLFILQKSPIQWKSYWEARMKYFKFLDVIKIRQKIFQNVLAKEGNRKVSRQLIKLCSSIITIDEFMSKELYQQICEVFSRALSHDRLNVQLRLTSQIVDVLLNIRKEFHDKLKSKEISYEEKYKVRKVFHEIESFIKSNAIVSATTVKRSLEMVEKDVNGNETEEAEEAVEIPIKKVKLTQSKDVEEKLVMLPEKVEDSSL